MKRIRKVIQLIDVILNDGWIIKSHQDLICLFIYVTAGGVDSFIGVICPGLWSYFIHELVTYFCDDSVHACNVVFDSGWYVGKKGWKIWCYSV